jgi:hypothetical protein
MTQEVAELLLAAPPRHRWHFHAKRKDSRVPPHQKFKPLGKVEMKPGRNPISNGGTDNLLVVAYDDRACI